MLVEDFTPAQRNFVYNVAKTGIWPSQLLKAIQQNGEAPACFKRSLKPHFSEEMTRKLMRLMTYVDSKQGTVDAFCAETIVNMVAFEEMFPLDMGSASQHVTHAVKAWDDSLTTPRRIIECWFNKNHYVLYSCQEFKNRAPVFLCKTPALDLLKSGYGQPKAIRRFLEKKKDALSEFSEEALSYAYRLQSKTPWVACAETQVAANESFSPQIVMTPQPDRPAHTEDSRNQDYFFGVQPSHRFDQMQAA